MLEHRRTCHLCEANCGLIVATEGRTVLSIKGDPQNALSRGYVCPKATAIQDLQEDPDRLRRPLKRVGDIWEEIGWAQAYAEIGERTRAIMARDSNSVALYFGNPGSHNYGTTLNIRLLKSALTPKVFSAATMDQMPHLVANLAMYGHAALFPIPDIDRTETMIVLGGNPMASNGSVWTVPDFRNRAKALKRRGGMLVVIDPRRSETAKIADRHLFIRPATDPWFLVALLKAVLASPLRPTLPPYVRGLGEVAAVLECFDENACARICGVSNGEIEWLAGRLLSGPAALYGRMGISVQQFGTLNAWLIALINIASGQMDREGGLVFPAPAIDPVQTNGTGSTGRWRSRVSGHPEVMGETPVAALAEEIETPGEGQIKALFVLAGNPVLSTPNGGRLNKALEQLELMVSIDIYRNATSRLAHYILPPAGPLERDHYSLLLLPLAVRNFAKYSPALFEPEAGAQQDWEIIRGIVASIRGQAVQDPPPRDRLDAMLRAGPYGISLEELEAHPSGMDFGPPEAGRLPQRLCTAGKTIECAPPTLVAALSELGNDDQPQMGGHLQLIGRRHVRTNNSWLANSPRLVKGPPRCTLMIHPDDAAARGIDDGAMAQVRSRTGLVRLPAEVTDDMMRGVVSIPHGWGHGLEGIALATATANAGVSANDLTDERLMDPLSGNATFSGVPVVVELAPVGREQHASVTNVGGDI